MTRRAFFKHDGPEVEVAAAGDVRMGDDSTGGVSRHDLVLSSIAVRLNYTTSHANRVGPPVRLY